MIKKGIVCALYFCCLPPCQYAHGAHCIQKNSCACHRGSAALWAVPTALIGSALAFVGFSWFHTPKKFEPTQENLQITTLIPREYHATKPKLLNLSVVKQQLRQQKNATVCIDLGQRTVEIHSGTPNATQMPRADKKTISKALNPQIKKTKKITSSQHPVIGGSTPIEPVWLISPGFMGHRPQKYSQEVEPESGIDQAAHFISGSIVHGPCVTFNYNDDRRVFNFGQTADLACLKTAYNLVKNQDIVLIGTCRGATTTLNLLSQLDKKDFTHIKAIILESPGISLQNLTKQVAHSYIGWMPKSPTILHSFFRFWFPNYDPAYPSFLEKLSNIPQETPILIGHLEGDKVISHTDIMAITQRLRKTGHTNVYVTTVQDNTITHARLSRIPAFQQVVNAFLKHYGIAHDPELALRGEPLLEKALVRTVRVSTV